MRALVDTSVLLRLLFGEPEPLSEWSSIREAFASRLLPLELGRVFDRVRLAGEINDADVEHLHCESRRLLGSIDVVSLSENILQRASGPMPTTLGSLDAIHLATALELCRVRKAEIVLATHDTQLARAARASGLRVVGA
jgi:hypothetical protein